MTRGELIRWATRHGWTVDRWGHLKKDFDGRTYRLKLSTRSLRYEVRSASGEWYRLSSEYYCYISIVDDQLKGLRRFTEGA